MNRTQQNKKPYQSTKTNKVYNKSKYYPRKNNIMSYIPNPYNKGYMSVYPPMYKSTDIQTYNLKVPKYLFELVNPSYMNVQTINPQYLLSNTIYSGLLTTWKRFRILSLTVNVYSTNVSSSTAGMIYSALVDEDGYNPANTENIMSNPRSVARRIYQITKLVYKPNEPSDLDFAEMNKTIACLAVGVYQTDGNKRINGDFYFTIQATEPFTN